MKEEIADLVYPVLQYGLRLKERLERGDELHLFDEQATLKNRLLSELESTRFADFGGDRRGEQSLTGTTRLDPTKRVAESFLGLRYALVCWLDEIFIDDSPWAAEWKEHKLETALYGTNERAWAFWEQARRAEARTGTDALEVFYLCVMLGFRGDHRHDPDRLQAWISATIARISRGQGQELRLPNELPVTTDVPPRSARGRFQRMVLVAGAYTLAVALILTFALITYFAS
jgi:type VI secretion system protein ImpK